MLYEGLRSFIISRSINHSPRQHYYQHDKLEGGLGTCRLLPGIIIKIIWKVVMNIIPPIPSTPQLIWAWPGLLTVGWRTVYNQKYFLLRKLLEQLISTEEWLKFYELIRLEKNKNVIKVLPREKYILFTDILLLQLPAFLLLVLIFFVWTIRFIFLNLP